MTRFQPITTVAEVRALQQAGLLWWRNKELASTTWLLWSDEALGDLLHRDKGVFSILLEE